MCDDAVCFILVFCLVWHYHGVRMSLDSYCCRDKRYLQNSAVFYFLFELELLLARARCFKLFTCGFASVVSFEDRCRHSSMRYPLQLQCMYVCSAYHAIWRILQTNFLFLHTFFFWFTGNVIGVQGQQGGQPGPRVSDLRRVAYTIAQTTALSLLVLRYPGGQLRAIYPYRRYIVGEILSPLDWVEHEPRIYKIPHHSTPLGMVSFVGGTDGFGPCNWGSRLFK
ncbi:hypothetical protein EV426DRAFT_380966 [Tirmania nivea]|nr:hypothetical protein EV426DRAFT_380966 [Tirmania nivea]